MGEFSGEELGGKVTPPSVFWSRRNFVRAGAVAGTAVATGLAYRWLNGVSTVAVTTKTLDGVSSAAPDASAQGFTLDEPPTPLEKVAGYNNFYEFTTNKQNVAEVSKGFDTTGWKVSVEGLAAKPRVF